MPIFKCPRAKCGYEWFSIKFNPVSCPKCRHYFKDKPIDIDSPLTNVKGKREEERKDSNQDKPNEFIGLDETDDGKVEFKF